MNFRDLGRRIHLSLNATAERVRRLQKAGVIRGFRAEIDPARLGFSVEAYIDVKLQPRATAQSFEASIRKIPGVMRAAILTGAFDFRVRVACKDQSDLVRVIETLRMQAGIQETSSALICREIHVSHTPGPEPVTGCSSKRASLAAPFTLPKRPAAGHPDGPAGHPDPAGNSSSCRLLKSGRGSRTRTGDPLLPKQVVLN